MPRWAPACWPGPARATGRVVVRATGVGADTQWARLTRRVQDAQLGKASVQRLADKIAGRFVPVVLVLALYTFGFWWFAEADAGFAIAAAMAVLVVACPCALGLATPTALAVAAGRGRKLGILLRGPQVLETTKRVDTVVLDKTGTVTTGRMGLRSVHLAEGVDDASVWRRVVALETDVDHPVARALVGGGSGRRGGNGRRTSRSSTDWACAARSTGPRPSSGAGVSSSRTAPRCPPSSTAPTATPRPRAPPPSCWPGPATTAG